ncbi:MAG: hypothetical protein RL335_1090 [Bacteroidota bacterium]
MKNFYFGLINILWFNLVPFLGNSQTFSQVNSVLIEGSVLPTNDGIFLEWNNDVPTTQYTLYRRTYGAASWGAPIATLSGTISSYTDAGLTSGVKYEYKILRNSTTNGYGYLCSGIDTDINYDPGIVLLVIDDYFIPALQAEIDELVADIESDGWFAHIIQVNRSQSVESVKSLIANEYNSAPTRVKSVFLLGHVPVPYSGDMNPDGHPDHLGAWPADVYYADMDGTWTDNTVNNNTAVDIRNHNLPGDGKFDQYFVQSNAELQIARVDFYNLPIFSATETELMSSYLNKLHAFKTKGYVPLDIAVVEDNFTGLEEGFAAGGYMSFSPIVGRSSVSNGDYGTSLQTQDYLWSYGTGPGSYIDAQGIVSSAEFAGFDYNSTFTMLFGSYFGDWDSQNNLLRSALASGRILCSSWSGRPNLFYHPMGMGENIGECIRISQNNTTNYFASTTTYFKRWTHIAQMGDPTLRSHYVDMASNLIASGQSNGNVDLSWTAPLQSVAGYNVYRRSSSIESWTRLNASLVTGTTYTDNSLIAGGNYEYMVRSVVPQTTGSGRYLNESLGVKASTLSVAGIEDELSAAVIYPNPFEDELIIHNLNGDSIEISNSTGQVILRGSAEDWIINTSQWVKGIYFLKTGNYIHKIIRK